MERSLPMLGIVTTLLGALLAAFKPWSGLVLGRT
jgi:hypothetical protein